MKKLPAVSEMEHITSREFGENMDAILERVSKENIALIIDHEDKSYVLCPARWFEVPELTQLEVMVKNAVRYVSEVDDSDLAETARTVKEASDIVLTKYERPADMSNAVKVKRAGFGQAYYDAYANTTTTPEKEEITVSNSPLVT